jgi:nicotinamidase-related amidase
VTGSQEWRIVPELTPGDTEPLIEKNYGDSFEDTALETILSGLGGWAPRRRRRTEDVDFGATS